jgi:NTP pyrophosphatase (non-canonical NTP hydrolase)
MLTFDKFSETNRRRNREYFADCKEWLEVDWGNAIAGEVGELCNMIKKRRRSWKDSDRIPDVELGKEIADAICYLDLLADKLGLNLGEIVASKFNEISDRYDCNIKL